MVLHFALLDFITSCVKVITFRVVITSCVNGITSRGDYYILRQYYILRRNTGACPESDPADLLFLGTSFNNVGKGGVSAHNIIGKP